MSNANLKVQDAGVTDSAEERQRREIPATDKPAWETPKMEDVSREVMAQPYIRFT
jgi:hypothetical protein